MQFFFSLFEELGFTEILIKEGKKFKGFDGIVIWCFIFS